MLDRRVSSRTVLLIFNEEVPVEILLLLLLDEGAASDSAV